MSLFDEGIDLGCFGKIRINSPVIKNNLWVLPAIMTFLIFNILKTQVFSGVSPCYMESFYTCVLLFIALYFHIKEDYPVKKDKFLSAIQIAIVVFLVSSIAATVNPCAGYLPPYQITMFNALAMFLAYNIAIMYMAKHKDSFNKQKINHTYSLILLVILVAKIHISG